MDVLWMQVCLIKDEAKLKQDSVHPCSTGSGGMIMSQQVFVFFVCFLVSRTYCVCHLKSRSPHKKVWEPLFYKISVSDTQDLLRTKSLDIVLSVISPYYPQVINEI